MSIAPLLQVLVQAGHSNTAPRRAVLRVLAEADDCLDAVGLLERARSYHPSLGLVTVYRTLELLTSLGLARYVHREDGEHSYVRAAGAHGHHLVCRLCYRAVEFEGCAVEGLIERLACDTGYRIEEHRLELFGVCPDCQVGERSAVLEDDRHGA